MSELVKKLKAKRREIDTRPAQEGAKLVTKKRKPRVKMPTMCIPRPIEPSWDEQIRPGREHGDWRRNDR